MSGVVRGTLCALRVTRTLAPTRLSTSSSRLSTSSGGSRTLAKVPRVAVSLSPAWTGLPSKEALCLVPAWDYEKARSFSTAQLASADLASVKTSITEFFSHERRELLKSDQAVANVGMDAVIALCRGADGVRLVLPAEYEVDDGRFHSPIVAYDSPVPSTWRPDPNQMRLSGASEQEIEEVEAAIAAVRERLGEPERVGSENEVLDVRTKEEFEAQVLGHALAPPAMAPPAIAPPALAPSSLAPPALAPH